MIFVDTSILGSVYIKEAVSESAHRILSGSGLRAISNIIEVEFYSVVSRRIRERELTVSHANDVITAFRGDVESDVYKLIHLEARDYQLAKLLLGAFNTSLRTLDALHASVAKNNGLRLVTADKKLAAAMKAIRADVQLVTR